jgi:Domain of unknown function (DUF4845)
VHRSGQFETLPGSPESEVNMGVGRQGRLASIRRQRGSSRLKLTIFTAIAVALLYTGVKVIPILINDFQFQDAIESTARFASVNRQTPEDIRAAVLKEAQEEDIPIVAQDIHVKGDNGHVEIAADYSVTVNLILYQWTLNFHPYAKNNPLL